MTQHSPNQSRLQHPLLTAIRHAFQLLTPLFLIGAAALMLQCFPDAAVRRFIETALGGRIYEVLELIYQATFGFAAVYLVFALAYCESVPKTPHSDLRLLAAANACACYIAFLGPEVLRGEVSLLNYTNMANLFSAMLVAHGFTQLFFLLYRIFLRKRLSRRSTAFQRSLFAIFPILTCLVLVAVLVEIIGLYPNIFNFNDLVLTLLAKPFERLGGGYFGGLLALFAESAFWLFGIHGGNVLDSVLRSEAGVFSFSSGAIVSKPFLDTYALLGGCGMTVCLLLAMLLFGRSRKNRRLCRLSALPVLFNINELLIFGLPIVLNPIYAIPFVLTPLVSYTIAYLATIAGLVPPIVNASVQWTTPIFLSGYQATGSIAGSILQLVILAAGVAIYAPFVRLGDRLAKQNEAHCIDRLTDICRSCEAQGRDYSLDNADLALHAFEDDLAAKLGDDIARGSILLQYQPQVENEKVVAAEALLRFRFNDSNFLYPPLVVGIACTENLFEPLSRVIVRRALSDLAAMQETVPDFKIAVNLRLELLRRDEFRAFLVQTVKQSGIRARTFGVELTEDAGFSDPESFRPVFDELKQAGIEILMDDFSMGHTSITILQKNYFDYVKIDGSLTRALDNERSRSIVSSIIRLGQELNFRVVAEYVETAEQRDQLAAMGCTIYQGYLYYQDMPADALLHLLKSQQEEKK